MKATMDATTTPGGHAATPTGAATLRPVTLLVCALGGEGGGVLTEWLVAAARIAGYPAQSSSIPGVAQRTGATTYYLEVFPLPLAELGARRPVLNLFPVPGALDLLVSTELLETARQCVLGMPSPQRTHIISSAARALTTAERMEPGDGRADAQALVAQLSAASRTHQVLDMAALAREAGTMVSAVMLGCIAGSGLLPMPRAAFEAAIGQGGSADASRRGFAAGWQAVQAARAQTDYVAAVLAGGTTAPSPQAAAVPALDATLRDAFPAAVHDMLALGHARVREYQDAAYAARYVQRLQRVLDAERTADPLARQGFAVTREMARWLALWMAFDDIVRVADLKSRASRWQRVRREVKAGDDDLLRVYDHFKPGVPEFAALLPPRLADALLGWDRRRMAVGKPAFALPLKVGSHSVGGMLALRTLAALRRLRPLGQRFAQEQALIERWLAGVVQGLGLDWSLGHELALCGRLIKGYGSTNERGKETLLHVVAHLAPGVAAQGTPARDAPATARAIAAVREAALADAAGNALDATLLRHGAPPRPVPVQPIRWVRKPKKAAATSPG